MKKQRVLKIRDLSISFKTGRGMVDAIRGVKLDLFKGETLAIVGESGSGKSVTTKAIMGNISSNGVIKSGSIEFTYDKENNGNLVVEDIVKMNKKDISKNICGRRIAMVFQDPMTSLNPTMTIGKQVMEAMIYHHHLPKEEAFKKAVKLLEEVGITDAQKRMKNYPHQLSGGMRQRVVIAIALSCEPEVLICDEPTTALDVTIQAQILELINDLKERLNTSVILITHDFGVVAGMADKIAVMYAGQIIERGTKKEIFYNPKHPYTWALLNAVPKLEWKGKQILETIPGTPPDLIAPPKGCGFAKRCKHCMNICLEEEPAEYNFEDGHVAKCWLYNEEVPSAVLELAIGGRD